MLRQQEMLPLLAEGLQVPASQVFYTWAFRRSKQHGRLPRTDWVYFFHGLECDLKNTADGRFLRVDFGPKGSVDTFTLWGVLQLIMTSTALWPELPELRRVFAREEGPFDQFSGSVEKLSPVWENLLHRGALEKADQGLVDLLARSTSVGSDGLSYVHFPPDVPEETRVDCSVAHRLLISPLGHAILQAHLVGHCSGTADARSKES